MSYDKDRQLLYIDTENDYGITQEEIARCLKDFRRDANGRYEMSIFCDEKTKINKWAKYKPIRYPKWTKLEEDEFMGTTADNNNNIFYGLYIAGASQAVIDETLVDIHDATFEYLPPRGVTAEYNEPFRRDDFDGYKHNAVANPSARLYNKIGTINDGDWERGGLSGIQVVYTDPADNLYGVDFTEMLVAGSSESVSELLGKTYPCILITDEDDNSFFTALDYPDDGNPRPLYYQNAYQGSPNWSCRFDKPVYDPANLGGAKPWTENKKATASVFLIKSASGNGPYLGAGMLQNFSEYWINLNLIDQIAVTSQPIVIAGANGVEISLEILTLETYYIPSETATPNVVRDSLYVFTSRVGDAPEYDCEVTITAEVGSNVDTKVASVSQGATLAPSAALDANALGILAGGGEYTVKVTVQTSALGMVVTHSKTYTITA